MQDKEETSGKWVPIVVALISAIATIVAAYFGYLAVVDNADSTESTSQTAEAERTSPTAAPSETTDIATTPSAGFPTVTVTPVTPTATTAAPEQEADTPAPEVITETRRADGMVIVYVPGGTFEMGGDPSSTAVPFVELPPHDVTLGSYWIDKLEVANFQYDRCVANGVCDASFFANDSRYNEPGMPAVGVSWHSAKAYCESVGAQLPTEAQWEFAARGPEGPQYPWGNPFDGNLLNYCDRNCGKDKKDLRYDDGYELTAPVASYLGGASWIGALDMSGNVWEWVQDWFGSYRSVDQEDPQGPPDGELRVLRGGAWDSSSLEVRSTVRVRDLPSTVSPDIGFRCARPAVE